MTWSTLSLLLEDMAPTLLECKQLVKVLLDELQNMKRMLDEKVPEENAEIIDKESEPHLVENVKEVPIDSILQKKQSENNCTKNTFETIDEDFEDKYQIETYEQENQELPDVSTHNLENNHIFVANNEIVESEEVGSKEIKTIQRNKNDSIESINAETHTSEMPYECKTCQKSFNQSGDLKRHERIHTGEKPFQCETCNKRFTRSCSLKSHERIHTGEKPYQCKTCNKRFARLNALKVHERIHTGEKPYQCETCKKRFNKKGHLDTHYRFHTGEKPYQCKTCLKRFKQNSNLKLHEKNTCQKRFGRYLQLKQEI